MILVANGCSHTAGAEIEHPQQGDCYEKAWPSHLGNLLNYDSINLSMSGASCHRVVRTTFEYLDVYAEKYNYDYKNLFFVIMWPGWYRTEIHTGEINKYNFFDNNWCPLVIGNDERYKETLTNNDYVYYKSWVNSLDRYHHIVDYCNDIILLQNTLQKYGIKYLFWNASCITLDRDPAYKPWLSHINPKRFPHLYNSEHCFTELCRLSGQNIAQPSIDSGFASHYDEEAHKWFANYLYNYLTKNNLL